MLVFTPELLNAEPGVIAGFTLAARRSVNENGEIPGFNFGDNTAAEKKEIQSNFDRLFREIDHKNGIVMADQVHGNNVKVVNSPGFYSGFDGFVTSTPDLMLGIKVADCAAVLIADPENGIVAAAHAGWRGAASGIIPNTLKVIEKQGANLRKSVVYISPCISRSNFEVGEEVARKFPDHVVDRSPNRKPHLDLSAYIVTQMMEAGIDNAQIEVDGRCTLSDHQFYSFRRERDRAGRMLGFIKYSPNE